MEFTKEELLAMQAGAQAYIKEAGIEKEAGGWSLGDLVQMLKTNPGLRTALGAGAGGLGGAGLGAMLGGRRGALAGGLGGAGLGAGAGAFAPDIYKYIKGMIGEEEKAPEQVGMGAATKPEAPAEEKKPAPVKAPAKEKKEK